MLRSPARRRAAPQESIEVPLPRSVFRAILARIAALCGERMPNPVSPYGGEGELAIGTNPPTVFQVAFSNTPDEQRLEITCLADACSAARSRSRDGMVGDAHPTKTDI
jgi:hypothetical protein